jgi:hypothetical protein
MLTRMRIGELILSNNPAGELRPYFAPLLETIERYRLEAGEPSLAAQALVLIYRVSAPNRTPDADYRREPTYSSGSRCSTSARRCGWPAPEGLLGSRIPLTDSPIRAVRRNLLWQKSIPLVKMPFARPFCVFYSV